MTAIWLNGDGRMGTALRRLVEDGDPSAGGLTLASSIGDADVVVDYSHPEWTSPLLALLELDPRPLLVGTTGLAEPHREAIGRIAQRAPVAVAANTGTGINALRKLVHQACTLLGDGWDVEILEMHHRQKVDAPSGTAWMLLDEVTGGDRSRAVASRVGQPGARSDSEVGIQALRGGDVVGEHTVFLVGKGERIELTHRCWDRDTFARGGLRAARWLAQEGRRPGLYSMDDVLGLGG